MKFIYKLFYIRWNFFICKNHNFFLNLIFLIQYIIQILSKFFLHLNILLILTVICNSFFQMFCTIVYFQAILIYGIFLKLRIKLEVTQLYCGHSLAHPIQVINIGYRKYITIEQYFHNSIFNACMHFMQLLASYGFL